MTSKAYETNLFLTANIREFIKQNVLTMSQLARHYYYMYVQIEQINL